MLVQSVQNIQRSVSQFRLVYDLFQALTRYENSHMFSPAKTNVSKFVKIEISLLIVLTYSAVQIYDLVVVACKVKQFRR